MGKIMNRVVFAFLLVMSFSCVANEPVETTSPTQLDEVVVSVQKRKEMARTVPISMTVLPKHQLTREQNSTVSDLATSSPNVMSTQANGVNTFTIRGIGGGGRNIGFDPRVGVYIDGIYAGQVAGLDQNLLGIDQAVVLRGPQGTMFGRNTVAGAVVLTSTPASEYAGGGIKASLGNIGHWTVEGHVGGPLGPVRSLVHVQMERRDGWEKNAFNSQGLNDRHRNSVRGQLGWDVGASTSLTWSMDRATLEEKSTLGMPKSTFFGLPLGQLHKSGFNTTPMLNVLLQGTAVNVVHQDASNRTWTVVAGVRQNNQTRINDTDYSSLDLVNIQYNDHHQLRSLEARVSNSDQARFRYVTGVYVAHDDASSRREVVIGQDVMSRIAFPNQPNGLPFGLVFGLRPGIGATATGRVTTDVQAIFGQSDMNVNDKWTIHAGARLGMEKKDVRYNLDGSNSGRLGLARNASLADRRHTRHLSPAVGVSFKPSSEHMGYLRWSEGYKSGGWNLDFLTPAQINQGLEFDDETVQNTELGWKGEVGRTSFDVVAFDTKIKDHQVFQFVPLPTGGSVSVLRNAARVQVRGVEAQARMKITPNLQLHAALGQQSAKFVDFPGGEGGRNLAGNQLPEAPKTTANIGVHAKFGAQSQWSVDAQLHHQSSSFAGVENKISERYHSRTTMDAQVSWQSMDNITLRAWVRNATNNRALQYQSRDFFGHEVEKNMPPRTYGMEVIWEF